MESPPSLKKLSSAPTVPEGVIFRTFSHSFASFFSVSVRGARLFRALESLYGVTASFGNSWTRLRSLVLASLPDDLVRGISITGIYSEGIIYLGKAPANDASKAFAIDRAFSDIGSSVSAASVCVRFSTVRLFELSFDRRRKNTARALV